MGQAFLDLYTQTNNKKWLTHAGAAAELIGQKFQDPAGGFSTLSTNSENLLITPVKHINSQIMMARFSNALYKYTKADTHKKLSEHAMRYLSSEDLTNQRRLLAGILLANRELNKDN